MRAISTLALAGGVFLALASQASADVQISMRDGRVSLTAKDATVRQILTEWARVGRTQIVNVERIAGGPITLEFTDVPEQEALDALLRSLSGYMVAPRAATVPNASQFERIIVMPTVAAPRPAASAAAAPPPPAPFGNLNGIMQPPPDENEANGPASIALPPALAPIFNNLNLPQAGQQPQQPQQPQPFSPRRPGNLGGAAGPGVFVTQPQNDAQVPAPAAPAVQPATNPFGAVSTPGMIAPAAQQPGQLVPQPPQPRRSPNEN